MLELYENIRALRVAKGLTQSQLAEKCGYSDKTMISKIEHGEIDLPISKIVTIANALDVPPNELLGDGFILLDEVKPRNHDYLKAYYDFFTKYYKLDKSTKDVIERLLETYKTTPPDK